MNSTDMGARIAEAKRKAEQEFREKKKLSLSYYENARDIFSVEDIERLLQENAEFQGRRINLPSAKRYESVLESARWLESHSMEVVSLKAERISSDRPNAVIALDIRRLASLRGEELSRFSTMSRQADTLFISGVKDEVVHFTFGIEKIWE